MCAVVIGVVRGVATLDELVYTAGPGESMRPWVQDHRLELRPLAARAELGAAWRALAAVTAWDATTLAHVQVVLRETVPNLDVPSDLPALPAEVRVEPPKPTAAHPRAYRGTKYRPPRPRQPEPVDLRPYLLTRRHIDQVLVRLGGTPGAGPDHDPWFVMYLLPLLGDEAGAFAGLARSLELQDRPNLRAALVGVYLAAGDPARALGWWAHVLAHPPEQRLEIAQLVCASGIAKLEPIAAALGAVLAGLDPVQQWTCYRALAIGAAPAYLLGGLASGMITDAKIEDLPAGREDVSGIVEATVERLAEGMKEDGFASVSGLGLWWVCGQQPELAGVLASADFVSLHPRAARYLIRLATSPRWTPETAEQEWRVLGPKLPLLVERATQVPHEYQRRFVQNLGDVYYGALGDRRDIAEALAKTIDVCVRVAKPPFATEAVLGPVLRALTRLPHSALALLRDMPEATWLALDDACARTNQARLVGSGIDRLAQSASELLVTALRSATPGALIETADALSMISCERAEAVIEAYKASALAGPALADAPLERLCEVVGPIARAGGPNPVRRALRRHLAGEVTLTEAQLRGHRARIVADLVAIRLAAIRQAVERELAARVGLESIATPSVRHALAMIGEVDVHRRQLRRMLAAVLVGDREWRLRHPRTQQWFARHPTLDSATWLAGISLTRELPELGEVRLAIETDPLEALKLGTYVGSCLSRGGGFAHSAAAIVLDVNKQVVYARDANGVVIGRQIVAIAETTELVCFRVYGAKRERLEPAFRDYDQALAARLGIPIYRGTKHDDTDDDDSDDDDDDNEGYYLCYEIASILSRFWWDDTAWIPVLTSPDA